MLVAAAVLVASRWDQLSDLVKLGLLAGATAACVWFGGRIKSTLPATGSVVFHLGLLLVPANVGAIAVHQGASLGQHLLSQGVVGAALFTAAAAATASVVFRWVAIASVPLVATGVGALTPVPALVVLIALAAVAELFPQLRSRHAVVGWAGLTGLAPVIVATIMSVTTGDATDVVEAIGLHGMSTAWATGLAATAVLAWRAEKERSLEIAGLAIASAVIAAASAIGSSHPPLDEGVFGIAAAFVLVEIMALAVTKDRFWSRPLSAFAALCEVPAWITSVGFGAIGIVFASVADGDFFVLERDLTLAAALLATTAGWLAAGARRQRAGGATLVNIAAATTGTAAVVFATASPAWSGATLAAIAVGYTATKRAPRFFGFFATPVALALTAQTRGAAAAVGAALAASMLYQAVVEERRGDAAGSLPRLLAVGACGSALLGAWIGIATLLPWALVAVAVIAVFSSVGSTASDDLGDFCRLWFVLPLVTIAGAEYQHLFLVSGAVAVSLVVDGFRGNRPELVGSSAVCAQIAVVVACLDSGLTVAQSGIALAFFAVVVTGISAIAEAAWQRPLLVAAGVAAGFALFLAFTDQQALTIVLLVLGALGLSAGLTTKNDAFANIGGAMMGVGFLQQLAIADVQNMELYVLPVAVHLAVAGEVVRRRGPVSSWLATAPGPALVASIAVVERISGGSAVHALIGAVVAGGAVAIGGSRRQAGPLLSGTAILAVLAGYESMSALAGMPAWGWIGIVGATLIAIAVMIERTDTSPVEAGRRLVDVISENFG